jgi:hypothetical protein
MQSVPQINSEWRPQTIPGIKFTGKVKALMTTVRCSGVRSLILSADCEGRSYPGAKNRKLPHFFAWFEFPNMINFTGSLA